MDATTRLTPDAQDQLRASVRAKYQQVSCSASGKCPYPIGPDSARKLGYKQDWIARVPADVADRFVGGGNPFSIREPIAGDRVLDLGCGAGFDTFVAASLVGATGGATGIDLTAAMLDVARGHAGDGVAAFVEGSIEALPFDDNSFDLAISNGVLNLVPDKPRAFAEIARVLAPGGTFAAADLLVIETIPPEELAKVDAWST
jgi:SAM-dependent methyltransferase